MEKSLKIGLFNYLNSLLIYKDLKTSSEIKILTATPKEIAQKLKNKELSAGQLSLYEYLKHKDKFVLLNDLCISSIKEVFSVCLFTSFKLEELQNKNIELNSESTTSNELLKVLFKNYLKINIKESENFNADAKLLIGDNCLKEKLLNNYKYNYDLALLWNEWQKLPFVFAVFVIRKDLTIKEKEIINNNILILKNNLQNNLLRLEEIDFKHEIFINEFIRKYYSYLNYQLTLKELNSIEVFNKFI